MDERIIVMLRGWSGGLTLDRLARYLAADPKMVAGRLDHLREMGKVTSYRAPRRVISKDGVTERTVVLWLLTS